MLFSTAAKVEQSAWVLPSASWLLCIDTAILLHDIEYVNLIKKMINDCKTNLNNYTDKGLVWELIKLKIRSVSIPYCIKKKKNMYTFKSNLIKDMNLLQIELDNDHSTVNQEKFIASKHELEQIEKYETHGHILKTKCTWTGRWRKKFQIFPEPRKKNYCNKLITSLEVDGKIIKDKKTNIAQAQQIFY